MTKKFFFAEFLISLVSYFIQVLLMLRIVLKLTGAGASAPFVLWVYNTTYPLISPFVGVFPSPQVDMFIIEFSSIFALVVYSVSAQFLIALLSSLEKLLSSENKKQ